MPSNHRDMQSTGLNAKNPSRSSTKRRSAAVADAVQPLEKRVMFAAFTPGDLVVYRIGTGASALVSGTSGAVFLDEYSPSGSLVQSIAMPATPGTGTTPNPLTATTSGTTEGMLTLSADGHYLMVPGYDDPAGHLAPANQQPVAFGPSAITGVALTNSAGGSQLVITTASSAGGNIVTGGQVTISGVGGVTGVNGTFYAKSISSSQFSLYSDPLETTAATGTGAYTSGGTWTTPAAPHEVARVDPSGNIDTTTTLGTALGAGQTLRGVASSDGSNIWASSGNAVVYTTFGSNTSTSLISGNLRNIEVVGQQLYVSASSAGTVQGVGMLGTGLPTTGPQTISGKITETTGVNAYGFYLTNLNGGTSPDTAYIADNTSGILKYSLVSGSWVQNGTVGVFSGTDKTLSGLTGTTTGTSVTLYATTNNGHIIKVTDTSGYNATDNGTATVIATNGSNTAIRGIAFVPLAPVATTTTVTGVTPTTANAGVPVTFTATVTAASGSVAPTGVVTFMNGTTVLATSSSTTTSGTTTTFTATSNSIAAGAYSNITAVYAPVLALTGSVATGAFGASTSAAFGSSLTINQPVVVVDNGPAPSILNGPANFTVTVSEPNAIGSGEVVTLRDANGNTNIGSGTLTSGSTTGTATVTVNSLAIGAHTIYAFYPGDTNNASASSAQISHTVTGDPQLAFAVSNEYVLQTDPTATVTVTRTGDTTDPVNVSYNTSDGTATTTTNYNAVSGTLSFAANQSTASFTVPLQSVAVGSLNGNKIFNVNLSNAIIPSGVNAGIAGVIASPAATVTILDTSGATTGTLAGISTNAVSPTATNESSGSSFIEVFGGSTVGAVSGSITQSYTALEFDPGTALFPVAGNAVTSLSNLSLTLFNANTTGNFAGVSGTINVYFAPDNTTAFNTSGSLRYQTSDLPGGVGIGSGTNQLGVSASTFLGTFNFDGTQAKVAETSALSSYSPAVASQIIYDLNNGIGFRLVLAAGDSTIAADMEGASTSASFMQYDPSLSLGVSTVSFSQTLAFNASSYTVLENAGTETITVNRLPGPGGDTSGTETVHYQTSDGTAVAGTNYNAASGTLTFGPGVTSQNIVITLLPHVPQGGDKTFNVSLSSVTLTGQTNSSIIGVIASPTTVVTTIQDAQETFALSNSAYTVNETAGVVEISVTRTGNLTDSSAVVNYQTSAGTAVDGTNYTGTQTGTLTFAAGQQVGVLSIPILNASQTSNLTFSVNLLPATVGSGYLSAIAANSGSGTVTIVDNATFANNLNSSTNTINDIETSGQFTTNFAIVNGDANAGTGSFSFLAYEILTFSPTSSPGLYPAIGTTVNSISNITLQLYNSATTGTFAGHPGNFDVWYLPDTTTAQSTLRYNTSTGVGILASQFTSAPVLLGTFSFSSSAVGYDSYSLQAANLPSGVSTAILSALNNAYNASGGSTFELAVTPVATGVGSIAADFYGNNPPFSPTLSISAATTVVNSAEYVTFSQSSYSAPETAGMVPITLTRTGSNISDQLTVNYNTSDGTALAGVNYNATSGTATFLAGSNTTTIYVPVLNVAREFGDKTLNITLSSPLAVGPGTVATLASPSVATLTIQDTSAGISSNTDSPSVANAADIEGSGPFSNAEVKTSGNSGHFLSYGVIDFASSIPSTPITAINSISLNVTNFATLSGGPVDFYLVADSSSNINASTPQTKNPHFYDSTQGIEGLGSQFGTKLLLGSYNVTDIGSGDSYTISLGGYSLTTEAALIGLLNSGSNIRIVVTPEATTTFTNWTAGATSLSISTQQGAALPAWLGVGSNATWNSSNDSLVVSGASSIVYDPGTDEPNITFAGSGAVVTIVRPFAGPAVHLGSATITNGGTVSVTAPATSRDVLVISSTGGLNIDSTGKLDLGSSDLILQGGNLNTANGYLTNGYANGHWNGAGGIGSAAANSDPTHLTALGLISNSASQFSTFDGVPVTSSDVLVKFTYYGDATVGGSVISADYARIDNGFLNHLSGWANGDFNYDNVINGSDYTLIDNAFNMQGTAVTPSAQIASPGATPASIAAASTSSDAFFSDKKVKPSLISDLETLITGE